MDLIWIVPLAVLVVGLVPVLALAGRVATELHAFRVDAERWAAAAVERYRSLRLEGHRRVATALRR